MNTPTHSEDREMMEVEKIDIETQSMEVKHKIISLLKLNTSVKIDNMFLRSTDTAQQIDAAEYARRDAINLLSKYIEDFIETNVNPWEQEVTATIYMPYVKNQRVKDLEKDVQKYQAAITAKNYELRQKNEKIARLLTPWWKKLWQRIEK